MHLSRPLIDTAVTELGKDLREALEEKEFEAARKFFKVKKETKAEKQNKVKKKLLEELFNKKQNVNQVDLDELNSLLP